MSNPKTKHYDAVSLLASEYEMILENLFGLEEEISGYKNSVLSPEDIIKLAELFSRVYERTVRYFSMEEDIVFPHLENVLPPHASPAAMKNEHNNIIESMYVLKQQLSGKTVIELPVVQSEILKIAGGFQRIYHKKQDVMYRELYTFFDDTALENIYTSLQKAIS